MGGFHEAHMGARVPMGAPSLFDDRESFAEGRKRKLDFSDSDTSLASAALVPPAAQIDGGPSNYSSKEGGAFPAPPLPKRQHAELGFRRLEDIRKVLRAQQVSEETIAVIVQAWAPSTNKDYDSIWGRWSGYALSIKQDPCTRNVDTLNAWLATMISQQHGLGEGSFDKYKTVISSTWDVMHDANTRAEKLSMTSAKTNGRKTKGLSRVWNIFLLHHFVHTIDVSTLDFHQLTQNVVVKLRGVLGWRSADIHGLFLEYSFEWRTHSTSNGLNRQEGVFIRAYDTKTIQGGWTKSSFIPALAQEHKNLCAYSALRLLVGKVQKVQDVPKIEISDPSNTKVQATPLLLFSKKGRGKEGPQYFPLKLNTVKQYFRKYFMQQVQYSNGALDKTFKPHSVRNAVASALHKVQVPEADIAAHLQTSAESLKRTYIRPVDDWNDVPPECFGMYDSPVFKVLTQFIHHTTKGGGCGCSKILPFNASAEEQRSVASA